jgi:diadenosine tetraphosphatase ApaH/serine/threonine PP2A family protein phosphatase
MPPAALISQSIFCMHGGLSPSMTCLDDVLTIDRPCNIESSGLICDLLWSDPHASC